MAKARDYAAAEPVLAVIGDSSFLHSGMAALANITYQGANVTVLLLDNRSTAMTGGQNNPANGRRLDGTPAPRIVCSQVRIGERVEASEIRPGAARLLIAFEAAEGLRWGHFL